MSRTALSARHNFRSLCAHLHCICVPQAGGDVVLVDKPDMFISNGHLCKYRKIQTTSRVVITRRTFLAALPACAQASAAARLDESKLKRLLAELEKEPNRDLRGIRILVDGEEKTEAYFNGGGRDVLHDIRSAGKSITSLLAGIAIDRGFIRDARQPLLRLLNVTGHPDKSGITLEDLLTMRSGLDADDADASSPGNESRLDESSSWLDFALAVPMRRPPGQTYVYCSLNAFLVGAAIEDSCKQRLDDFARQHLFGPLGIRRFEWRRGPQSRVAGQGNLRLTVRDMSAIGQMCLNKGRVPGRQVVRREWIERSLAPIVSIAAVDPYADSYGYMWYTKTYKAGGASTVVHFASGNGGNKIYIVPRHRMVIAIASAAYGRPHGQRRSEDILRRVLFAVGRPR